MSVDAASPEHSCLSAGALAANLKDSSKDLCHLWHLRPRNCHVIQQLQRMTPMFSSFTSTNSAVHLKDMGI